MRVTTTRARVFQASLAGTLKKNATTITLHVDYLSLHQVQVLDRQITIDHDVTEPIWTKREITQVRNKYQCTCCNQFVTGWTCPHVLACLALLEKFPLSTTTQHLPVRKPPRRPRKIPRPLVRDDTTTAFFEVDNLIELLLSKPSRLLKFPVLIEKETTKENVPGVVSTWLNQNGVYKWNVTLSDGSTRLLECQELADAIHFANTTGMRRPPVSWQKDGVDGGPSSVDVILKWITTEGNLQRWCGDTVGGNTKKACITGRTYKGVLQKINDIQDSYNKAADLKRQSGEGIPDEDEAKIFHDKLVSICKHWDILDPVFHNLASAKPVAPTGTFKDAKAFTIPARHVSIEDEGLAVDQPDFAFLFGDYGRASSEDDEGDGASETNPFR
ncbi:hypothetical protein F441_21460 [Phytophthora nicotianae CJ01A1]|nr:hypothetical protein F441_21460 [Phytophthora nicotianae CJ01A1]